MITYIYSTGIGLLLSITVSSQAIHLPDDPLPATTPVLLVNEENKEMYDLPRQGTVASFSNEIMLYNGAAKNHRLHGSWKSWYTNGNLCDSGSFVKGFPSGEWKHWDMNGNLLSVRNYNAGKLLRIKDEIRRNHPRTTVYPLTALYKKNSREAKKYMQAGYSFGFKTGNLSRLSLQAAVERNITPGNTYYPVFSECLHHGLYMNFYDDGRVKDSGYYKNGLRDGVWIQRDADNNYFTGAWKNGVKQGEWKQYNANDKLLSFVFYNRKGEEEWRKSVGSHQSAVISR